MPTSLNACFSRFLAASGGSGIAATNQLRRPTTRWLMGGVFYMSPRYWRNGICSVNDYSQGICPLNIFCNDFTQRNSNKERRKKCRNELFGPTTPVFRVHCLFQTNQYFWVHFHPCHWNWANLFVIEFGSTTVTFLTSCSHKRAVMVLMSGSLECKSELYRPIIRAYFTSTVEYFYVL